MFPLRIVRLLSGVVIFMSQIVVLTPNGNYGLCRYCIHWAMYWIFYFLFYRILCCPHADLILPKLPAPHKRLSRLALEGNACIVCHKCRVSRHAQLCIDAANVVTFLGPVEEFTAKVSPDGVCLPNPWSRQQLQLVQIRLMLRDLRTLLCYYRFSTCVLEWNFTMRSGQYRWVIPPHHPTPRYVLFNARLSLELPNTERIIPTSKQSRCYKRGD
jgi:hypothetical protein